MSGKLGEVESRIGTVHHLEAVITAMRGSVAARSREARSRLNGIRAYAAAIGGAIGQALALAPESDPPLRKPQSPEGHVVDGSGATIDMFSEGDLIGRSAAEQETRQDWWLTTLAEGGRID